MDGDGDRDDVGVCRLVRRISDTDYTVLLHWILQRIIRAIDIRKSRSIGVDTG
jgi:hypothetical protein